MVFLAEARKRRSLKQVRDHPGNSEFYFKRVRSSRSPDPGGSGGRFFFDAGRMGEIGKGECRKYGLRVEIIVSDYRWLLQMPLVIENRAIRQEMN